jgi:hypothetical protein
MTVGGGFPNIEGMVLADGSVEVTYYCGMRVTPRGVFEGVEANDRVLPPAIAKEITRIAETLGKAYSTAGYRGYFEIDCLMGIDGNLYVSEANLRRNGGTYVRHLAKRLLGADWFTTSFLVTRLIFLPAKIDTFDQLYTLLEPILYSKERKEGIVIVSSNLLKMGKLAYLIIGASRERVKELEQELFKQLNSSPAFA